jgi:SAM-dependent methyltransferase
MSAHDPEQASGATEQTDHDRHAGAWSWDQRFAEQMWPGQADSLVVETVAPLTPGRAIDFGSGPGRNAIWLAQQGWDVTAVDASQVGLDQAGARAAAEGLELALVHADLLDYRPEAAFDLAVVANIHMVSPDHERLMAMAASALVPGGYLLVVGHHLDDLGRHGPPDADRLYTEARVVGALPPHLELIRCDRVERGVGDDPEASPDVAVIAVARAPRSG